MTIADQAKAAIDQQVSKGLDKYGQTLDGNPAPLADRLQHLKEELADGLQYVIWAMEEAKRKDERIEKLENFLIHLGHNPYNFQPLYRESLI